MQQPSPLRHLIVIGSVWPEPASSAAGSRLCQLLAMFQIMRWRITFASAAQYSEHGVDLAAMGVAQARIALNDSSFDDWLAQQAPDAVMFDRFMTEEQFGWRVERTCPEAMRLLDTEDLHSLRAIRGERLRKHQQAYPGIVERHSVGPVLEAPDALFDEMMQSDIAQRELASIYRSDLSLMISPFEMRLLQQWFGVPASLLCYLPLLAEPPDAADEDRPASLLPDFEERRHFISMGNFRHAPNWDAVLWLKHQLWPAIRARLPAAELHVYGAYPPPKATALNQPKQGFLVKGWAPDALAVMRSSRVCLAPLRFGAGQKGKLLDAMMTGTPSVTTSLGAEGMGEAPTWPGIVADNADALVEAAVTLYEDVELWSASQARAATMLRERFAAPPHRANLASCVAAVMADLEKHRRHNVVGTLLRHQQHRSTQYMSQWIEVKNRHQQLKNRYRHLDNPS